MLNTKTRNKIAIALGLIGLYVALDGIGSIIIYASQPLFFDHMVRFIRIIVGGIIVIIAWKVAE